MMQNSNLAKQHRTKPSSLGPVALADRMLGADLSFLQPQAVLAEQPTLSHWQLLLTRFEPVSLAQMNNVALLNRTDTKFVLSAPQLFRTLAALNQQYRVLDVDGTRLNRYQTLYFDTADFALYLRHHAGGRKRYKVRSREYVDSHLSFLEIKQKVGGNRTIKNRVQTPGLVTHITPETDDFMEMYFPLEPQTLEPKLWNDFYRITLVSKQQQERLTLDLNLHFSSDNQRVSLPGVVIAEVKQAGLDRNSDFIRQMRALNVHPTGFSKYCVGVALLYPTIKHNSFKPKLQLLHKLMKGTSDVYRTH